jgi:hypothetical protein
MRKAMLYIFGARASICFRPFRPEGAMLWITMIADRSTRDHERDRCQSVRAECGRKSVLDTFPCPAPASRKARRVRFTRSNRTADRTCRARHPLRSGNAILNEAKTTWKQWIPNSAQRIDAAKRDCGAQPCVELSRFRRFSMAAPPLEIDRRQVMLAVSRHRREGFHETEDGAERHQIDDQLQLGRPVGIADQNLEDPRDPARIG